MIKSFEKELIKLIQEHDTWAKVINWFSTYKPEDKGIQFIWDSLYTDKYLQSRNMYRSMLKMVLNLYKAKNDTDFPYSYSSKRVNMIDEFFEKTFKLTEGTFNGKPFKLEPNQVFKLSLIYGLNKKKEFFKPEEQGIHPIFPVNRFYDTETRKNGKSMFFGALSVFVVLNPFGNDNKPEVYASGPDEKSSKLIYEKARDVVKSNKKLENEFRSVGERVFKTHNGAVISDLPFKTEALEGKNSSLVTLTETHLHKNEIMINSFESAENLSRINSLLVFDTTKGYGIYGVAYNKEEEYNNLTKEQLNNPDKIIGITISTFMAEVDEEDNPEDVNLPWEINPYRKSTPMINKIISLEALQNQWEIAKNNPVAKREFLIKKFGKWIGNMQSVITKDDLDRCNDNWKDKYKLEDFKGKNAIIAIDLANTGDTNAVSLIFKDLVDGVEIPIIHSKIFIPEKTLQKRIEKEKKPYHEWIEKGWAFISGDAMVNHEDIAKYIKTLIEDYKIKLIYYDPYQAHIIKNYLVRMYGISTSFINEKESPVKQTAAELSSPMEDYIKKIIDGNIYFFGNPVFIEHHINMVPSYNRQGQIYWTKEKQEHRVDIFSTCVTGMKNFGELPVYKNKIESIVEVWDF